MDVVLCLLWKIVLAVVKVFVAEAAKGLVNRFKKKSRPYEQ